jgi:hypothetical protein
VTALPQYSQVITISPNLGEIGAPQLGHFSDVAPEAATTGDVEVEVGFETFNPVLVPHFTQKAASSGICAPQLWQYIFSPKSFMVCSFS